MSWWSLDGGVRDHEPLHSTVMWGQPHQWLWGSCQTTLWSLPVEHCRVPFVLSQTLPRSIRAK